MFDRLGDITTQTDWNHTSVTAGSSFSDTNEGTTSSWDDSSIVTTHGILSYLLCEDDSKLLQEDTHKLLLEYFAPWGSKEEIGTTTSWTDITL